MFRINCIRLASVLVSIAGLASCSKDGGNAAAPAGPPRRVFATPRVVRQNVAYDLQSWGRESDRNLSLGETIELGTPPPKFTEVHATCGEGRQALTHRALFENEGTIPVFKFVPEEILARDLGEKPVGCTFIIQVGDDQVTRNGFEMFASIGGDHGDVTMTGRGISPRGPSTLRTKDLLGNKLTFSGAGDAEAQLLCRDLTFPKVPFAGELDLHDLRIDSPTVRPRVDPAKIVNENPDQSCRVVVSRRNDKLREEMTQLFTLRFNKEKWSAKTRVDDWVKAGVMLQGENFVLANYEITNLEDDPRRLRFNKEWFNVQVALNLVGDPNAVSSVDGPPWVRIFRDGPTHMVPLGANEEIEIAPHATAKYYLAYTVGGDIHCNHVRVRFRLNDKVVLQDVSSEGNIVNGVPLETPAGWITKVQFEPRYAFRDQDGHPADGCYW